MTPAAVHHGHSETIRRQRSRVLDAAYAALRNVRASTAGPPALPTTA